MPAEESVTDWIDELRLGDAEAAQKLWERYFERMVRVARGVLRSSPRTAADEEDAALSAFESFCRRAGENQFPKLDDRHDLWKLLVTIAVRKSLKQARKEQRRAAAWFADELSSSDPSPELIAELNEQIELRMERLRSPDSKRVALLKLQGLTHAEIAADLGRSISFVERKLVLIRKLWALD